MRDFHFASYPTVHPRSTIESRLSLTGQLRDSTVGGCLSFLPQGRPKYCEMIVF